MKSPITACISTSMVLHPFGMITVGRSWEVGSEYRYGFNGKESDSETYGDGNVYDYGFRIYNPRLGKFLSVDPLAIKFAYLTPYQFASNSPISGIDLDGLEYYYAADGSFIGKIGFSTEVMVVDDVNNVGKVKLLVEMAMGESGVIDDAFASKIANSNSRSLGIDNEQLIAFASTIHNETSNNKDEAYAIGNVTINFLSEGGSSDLKTLDDVTRFDNSFAQGATQDNYTAFKGLTPEQQNSKFAIGSAINALSFYDGVEGYLDYSNGADSWDGIDLVSTKWDNSHRNYIWSSDSKDLVIEYKTDNNGGIDVSKWIYNSVSYEIRATLIIGKTLFTNLQGIRGESKENDKIFE